MNRPRKLLFITNKLGSTLLLIYLMFNTYYAIILINAYKANSMQFVLILSNLFLSLLIFLTSTNIKIYKVNWIYMTGAIALYQIVRLGILFLLFEKPQVQLIIVNILGLCILTISIVVSYRLILIRKTVLNNEVIKNGK